MKEFTKIKKGSGSKREIVYWQDKSYGRIFLSDHKHINIVKKHIKQLDEFEYEYLSDDLFCVNVPGKKWEDTSLVYYGKFDISDFVEDLLDICSNKEIPIRIEVGTSYDNGQGYQESLEEVYGCDYEFHWS